MIEKKELDEAAPRSNGFSSGMLLDVTQKEVNRPTVLVRTMHISPAGPRTRRSPAGKHGASGVEKPQHTRSREWLLAAKWVPSTANSPEDIPQKCAAGRDAVQTVPFCK